MAILVTGGTGFIGTWVVRLLLEEEQKVVAYDIAPDRELAEKIIGPESESVILWGDVTDLGHLVRACRDHNVDTIIHTAALMEENESPYTMTRLNCGGTLNVFEAARILGIKRVVYASSRGVFGPSPMYKEEYIPNGALFYPMNIYGATKVYNEVCARHYFKHYGLDAIGIRFTGVYGYLRKRGQGKDIQQGLFIDPALGKPGKVAYGDSINNWVYVKDAARLMVMASKVKKTKSRVFTISGEVRSVAAVADYVKSLIPGADITLLPGVYRPQEKYDTSAIEEEIGFQREWTLERAIKEVVDYVQNRKEAGRFP